MTEASGLWAATVLVRAQCSCSLPAPADRHLRRQRRQIFQPFTDAQLDNFVARQTLPRWGVVARASDADGVSSNAGDITGDAEPGSELSETVLERLQKAEKEAADLRYQLSLARDMQVRTSLMRCSQMHAQARHTWMCAQAQVLEWRC